MKRRLGITFACVLAVIMLFALTACGGGSGGGGGGGAPADNSGPAASGQPAPAGGSSGEATYNLKASTYLPEVDPMYASVLEYCDTVKEKTNGDVVITVYPAESLGPYDQTFEETMRGTLEFGFNAVPATKDPRLESATIPGVVSDSDKLAKLYDANGTVFKTVSAAMDSLNVKLLGYLVGGYANVILAGDPEEGYADPAIPKKATIRVPTTIASFGDVALALNYKTAALNGNEVYSSLQTGIIDGSIGQSNQFVLSGFSDVVKSIIDYKVLANGDMIFINKDVFESMPAEYQQILQDAADELTAATLAFQRDEEAFVEEELAKVGITVIHLTPEEHAAIDAVIVEKAWPGFEQRIGKDFVEGVKKDFGIQ